MQRQRSKLADKVFSKIHLNNIVYNTCWEDPRCDRALMQFKPDSSIVMITSAGCNALDYLLDDPKEIHCVDMNPKQNALLHLKMAAIKHSGHEDLFNLFGLGQHPDAKDLYKRHLRPSMPDFAVEMWDKKLPLFAGKGVRKTFYYHGTSGTFAWLAMRFIRTRPDLNRAIRQMLESETLEEQRFHYDRAEKKLFGMMIRWMLNRHVTMSMLGVPKSQQDMLKGPGGGVTKYIQDSIRHVFHNLPIQDNYFYRVYLQGKYSKTCCPNYLKAEHQASLKVRTDKIKTHSTTISEFLKQNPGEYSHFVLLDHQDWLSKNDMPALKEEWEQILQNSKPGTKVLLRSAAEKVDFIPDFVRERMDFNLPELEIQKKLDRVGTYKGIELGIVK